MELLVVVAIIGILVAIAVPNLLDAIDRSKQRATVAEARIWGIALQDYNAQLSVYPPPSGATGVDDTLKTQLVPFTINTLQILDKWKNPWHYETNLTDTYTFSSCGKDGACGLGVTPATWFNFDLDIVLNDGVFVNSPS